MICSPTQVVSLVSIFLIDRSQAADRKSRGLAKLYLNGTANLSQPASPTLSH